MFEEILDRLSKNGGICTQYNGNVFMVNIVGDRSQKVAADTSLTVHSTNSKKISVANEILNDRDFQTALGKISVHADPVKVTRLENGITLYFLDHKDSRTHDRYASLHAIVKAGDVNEKYSRYSEIGLQQLAHFIEHCVFLGTENFTKEEITKFLDSIGCPIGMDANATTRMEYTTYFLSNIPLKCNEKFQQAVKLIYELVFCATFPESIMGERNVVIDEMERKRTPTGGYPTASSCFVNTPFLYNCSELSDNIFHKLPYNKLQTVCRQFYQEQYRTENVSFVCVGDFGDENAVAESLEYIKTIFSQKKKDAPTDRSYLTEPVKLRYGISGCYHEELAGSQLIIYQRYPIKKHKCIQKFEAHDSNVIDTADSRFLRSHIKTVLEYLVASICRFVLNEMSNELKLIGFHSFEWHTKQKTCSLIYERKFVINPLECKINGLFERILKILWNLPGEVTEKTLEMAKQEYLVNSNAKLSKIKKADHNTLVKRYYSLIEDPKVLVASTDELSLHKSILQIVKVNHLQRYIIENIALFDPNKTPQAYLHETCTINTLLPIHTLNKGFLSFIKADKPTPINTLPDNRDIFEGIEFVPKDWNSKAVLNNGIAEYQFSNGAKVILIPSEISEEVRATATFDIWPYILDPENDKDFLFKAAILGLKDHLKINQVSPRKLTSIMKLEGIEVKRVGNAAGLHLTFELTDNKNVEQLLRYIFLNCQSHHMWDLSTFKNQFEVLIRHCHNAYTKANMTSSQQFTNNMYDILYKDCAFSFNSNKFNHLSDLNFKTFCTELLNIFAQIPAPTIIIGGCFKIEEMEPLLKTYVGSMKFNTTSPNIIPSPSFPAKTPDKEFYARGEEGRTQTSLFFPLPYFKNEREGHVYTHIRLILSQYMHKKLRFESADPKIYSISITTHAVKNGDPISFPYFRFSLDYPTKEHADILMRFWETLCSFQKLSDEEITMLIENEVNVVERVVDNLDTNIDHHFMVIEEFVKMGISLENVFEQLKDLRTIVRDSIDLAQEIVHKDNAIRLTMHTTQNDLVLSRTTRPKKPLNKFCSIA